MYSKKGSGHFRLGDVTRHLSTVNIGSGIVFLSKMLQIVVHSKCPTFNQVLAPIFIKTFKTTHNVHFQAALDPKQHYLKSKSNTFLKGLTLDKSQLIN